MPKIVLKVDRKTNTRSKTQEDKRGSGDDEGKPSSSPHKNRSATPKRSAVKPEARSTITRIQRTPIRFCDRKFFTVQEDFTILSYFKDHEAKMTSRTIAENLAKKVKHTVESIRDRIKRFLSKLRPIDEVFIKEEAKVNIIFLADISRLSDCCLQTPFALLAVIDFRTTQTTTFTSRKRTTRRKGQSPTSIPRYQS